MASEMPFIHDMELEQTSKIPKPSPDRWTAEKLWPRRLLDITTMTSVEREEGNYYAGEREPKYGILSYTWGRFEVIKAPHDYPRLPIKGVSWKIPAINKSHFEPSDFHKVVNRIGEKNRFAWIDIACIDQDNYAVRMDEVGRQAGIFANAERAYIWLWKSSKTSLQSAMGPIMMYGIRIVETKLDDSDWDSMVAAMEKSVKYILDDHWFSSLWTIQEGYLRMDAMLLSREADYIDNIRYPITSRSYVPQKIVTLEDFRERLWIVYGLLTLDPGHYVKELSNKGMEESIDKTERRIRKAGYHCAPSHNPNIQFGAAGARKVSNELDRIYGIMGTYNVRVGAAVPGASAAEDDYTLEGLEKEFALAVNSKSMLLGQLFVHVGRPREGKTWQITQQCRVPDGFRMGPEADYITDKDCRITPTEASDGVLIEGSVCPLKTLCISWAEASRSNEGWDDVQLAVDDYLIDTHEALPDVAPRQEALESRRNVRKVVAGLDSIFGIGRISVLRLGERDAESAYSRLPGEAYGLLLLHDRGDWKQCWRLGICRWPSSSTPDADASSLGEGLPSPHRPVWEHFDGRFL